MKLFAGGPHIAFRLPNQDNITGVPRLLIQTPRLGMLRSICEWRKQHQGPGMPDLNRAKPFLWSCTWALMGGKGNRLWTIRKKRGCDDRSAQLQACRHIWSQQTFPPSLSERERKVSGFLGSEGQKKKGQKSSRQGIHGHSHPSQIFRVGEDISVVYAE